MRQEVMITKGKVLLTRIKHIGLDKNSQHRRVVHQKIVAHRKMGQPPKKKKLVIRVKRSKLSIYEI